MEKNIKIDSITVADIIRRINYNEEEILDMIEGLSEAASTLCYVSILFSALTRMFPKPTFAP